MFIHFKYKLKMVLVLSCSNCAEPEVWHVVANAVGVRRIAKAGRISADGFRTPRVTLLLGDDAWVHHVDNGIR